MIDTGEIGGGRPDQCAKGVVVFHSTVPIPMHSRVGGSELARWLAALRGFDFVGQSNPGKHSAGRVYYVPSHTLLTSEAEELNIRSADDLFGGVVPRAFVGTKAISHPLWTADAPAPAGWSGQFADQVGDAVLQGFTVFSRGDMAQAAVHLLTKGPIRLKPAAADGGRGQIVVAGHEELAAALDELDAAALERSGVVIEEDLTDTTTLSIGQVAVGDLVASYCGVQSLTRDNQGKPAYGGSSLLVARGDFDALVQRPLRPRALTAIAQALAYDTAANRCFPGLLASRRNYDVVQGVDGAGRRRSAVLEQSWRLGGASGAEVAALQAFAADPALLAVRASCREAYSEQPDLPARAKIYFQDRDPMLGALTKWAQVEDEYHA